MYLPVEILIPLMALTNMLIGFVSVIILSRSNTNFTKGEVQAITGNFVWGTMFMFGGMFTQFIVEYFHLSWSPVDLVKHLMMFGGMAFYLLSSYQIYNMSKVMGFASKDTPKKLRRVLKS